MGILADSAIVGAATFLVGSLLMEFHVGKSGLERTPTASNISKIGLWPYIGTFIAGSVGFFLVTKSMELLELNAEETIFREEHYPYSKRKIAELWNQYKISGECVGEDCICKRSSEEFDQYGRKIRKLVGNCPVCHGFFDVKPPNPEACNCDEDYDAESFSAEYLDGRKFRRRSRLSWTKGLEHDDYSTLEYWNNHISQPYTSIATSNAYYIDELPPGYHIHLWRPSKRSGKWRAYAKSPNNTAWESFSTKQKSQITQQILDWYNTSVGTPEDSTDLTPIQIMMLKAGLISDRPMISRTEIKGYDRKRFQDGRQVVVETIPNETQWYAHGGPEKIPMHKIASLKGDTLKIFPKNEISGKYAFADNFLRGLVFLDDAKRVGKESSVAKYNKDSKKWVSLYPAWFQNACANNVKDFKIEWFNWGGGVFYINDEKFLEFDNLDMVGSPFKWFDNSDEKIVSPTIQKKMWDKAIFKEEIDVENIKLLQWSIFAQCVDKYQPQKFSETTSGMYSWGETDFKITELWPCPQYLSRVNHNQSSYIDFAAHTFLRRLGKKK
jgi:hypothetical protein